jgi:ABC-type phosphate transport system substrate-binding protein
MGSARRVARLRRSTAVGCAVLVAAFSAAIGAAAPAAQASGTALIQGSGSTWAANAVNQWVSDVQPNGLQVVYTGTGSAQGRTDYANNTVDFAVSDIGYQGSDPVTHTTDTSEGRAYAYLPIVAGGTSFPYHLVVNGKQVTNLRLSGTTLAGIFTNKITNWDAPAIQHDNNLKQPFPSLPIIPVVHSEGSGDSAQFSRWLATDYASIWDAFGGKTFTEYWPRAGAQVAENGSDSVINFITGAAANGAIGYDEYSYALGAGYPVAKVLNHAGYYTLPDQYNVAVALTKAQINMTPGPNYLLQNLNNVYTNPEPQTYPLSSYSYMIEPTSPTDAKMTTAKRQTLADYLYYSICQGQQEMGPIGYSPLPVNLVEAGFSQIGKLKKADSSVSLTNQNVTTCNNPTFVAGHPSENHLAQIAPLPQSCDKQGQGPCLSSPAHLGNPSPGSNHVPTTTPSTSTTASTGATSPSKRTGGTAKPSGASSVPTALSPGAIPSGSTPTVGTSVDPNTGAISGPGASGGTTVAGLQTDLPAGQGRGLQITLAILAALLLIGAIVLPPALHRWLGRKDAA